MEESKKFRHPKMTIAEMNEIWKLCEALGIDPEQYSEVQYAGKLIFDLYRLQLCLGKIEAPNPADYMEGGKYDYTKYGHGKR
ncbi:MAG: hypothetical protein SOR11_07545 [Fusobacterium sp.]|uniref:hypothetical protein n=1 Tax=Fusobacterium sp. TaxID=68766 RepID=UPI002A755774|nr:hypothetical protein [Fusobacterium sp.]MDY3059836.1 hypothetical protein [Fusobacterium sp.]